MSQSRIEDLAGIQGRFDGKVIKHPDPQKRFRALAVGSVVYAREVDRQVAISTVAIKGVAVRVLHGPDADDYRRYIRIERGPKSNRDKIIAIID